MRSPLAAVGAPPRRRRLPAAATAVLAFALLVPSAGRPTVAAGGDLAIPRDAARTIVGPNFAAGFPRSTAVTNVGDVDGDKRPDLLIMNTQGHGGDQVRGNLLFGGDWPKLTRLPASGKRGIRVPGFAGAAGDVNGDERADLVSCGIGGRRPSILFGRAGRRPPAERGFGIATSSGGTCPRGVGDVDGDGFDDLIVDGPRGTAAVVFGRRPPTAVNPERPGANGFRIEAKKSPPVWFAPVGDLNGDRRADLVIDPAYQAKRVLVLFGKRRSGTVDPGGPGLPAIVGLGAWRGTIASAGDVNGDGVGDLIVGDRRAGPNSARTGGRACVILGRRGRWPATSACDGPRGVVIEGAPKNADLGAHVGAAGDLDGDGLGDLWVSAPSEQIAGSDFGGGAVYVVYGRRAARRIDLANDPRVVRIAATPKLGENLGYSVAVAGDLTGDRQADIVLGGDLLGNAWVVSVPTP